MTPERNPLDLNNFPDDFSSRDGKQSLEDTSSSAGYRKKKSGGKECKDESGKVYECRFCSLKFCKSQALGGHMNRHRQGMLERETETLNRARQLVFSNDNLIPQPPPHLGGQPMVHGGYLPTGNINDPTIPFRSVYSPRLFSGTNSTASLPPPPPPSQSYMYPSPSRIQLSYSSQHPSQPINDYFLGHVVPGSNQYGLQQQPNCSGAVPLTGESSNYTCIGAPVGQGSFVNSNGGVIGAEGVASGSNGGGRDTSLHNQRLDLSPINRYQDGF